MKHQDRSGTVPGAAQQRRAAFPAKHRLAPALVGALAVVFVPGGALAQVDAPQVVVRVYDVLGIGSSDRSEAGRTARGILSRAGIDVVWLECGLADGAADACERPAGPRDLVVRIMAAGPGAPGTQMGYALIDARSKKGTLATVFGDTVAKLAGWGHSERGRLMGRVMAHEVTHLILGETSHSPNGLMRASWSVAEIKRDRPEEWLMSPEDGKRLHRRLAAWSANTQAASAPSAALR